MQAPNCCPPCARTDLAFHISFRALAARPPALAAPYHAHLRYLPTTCSRPVCAAISRCTRTLPSVPVCPADLYAARLSVICSSALGRDAVWSGGESAAWGLREPSSAEQRPTSRGFLCRTDSTGSVVQRAGAGERAARVWVGPAATASALRLAAAWRRSRGGLPAPSRHYLRKPGVPRDGPGFHRLHMHAS